MASLSAEAGAENSREDRRVDYDHYGRRDDRPDGTDDGAFVPTAEVAPHHRTHEATMLAEERRSGPPKRSFCAGLIVHRNRERGVGSGKCLSTFPTPHSPFTE